MRRYCYRRSNSGIAQQPVFKFSRRRRMPVLGMAQAWRHIELHGPGPCVRHQFIITALGPGRRVAADGRRHHSACGRPHKMTLVNYTGTASRWQARQADRYWWLMITRHLSSVSVLALYAATPHKILMSMLYRLQQQQRGGAAVAGQHRLTPNAWLAVYASSLYWWRYFLNHDTSF